MSARDRRYALEGALAAAWGLFLAVVSSCTPDSSPQEDDGRVGLRFVDVTAASGIDFERDNGFDGRNWRVVETVNGGTALIDYDGDGWLDIYFTNGRKIDAGPSPPRNALYRNQGDGTFEDVSRASGTDDSALSLGCAVADVNGDGLSDLYVTNLGPNRLFRNRGDGTFEDIASEAGVAGSTMDAGAAFLDMDSDGDLDLYVAAYVVDDAGEYPPAIVRGVPGYWPPLHYRAAPDHLYENLGDGTFADVSKSSGIRDVSPGRGLGVLASDLNGDGRIDIYVANDMSANFLFLGDGTGRFVENALLSGVAFGAEGDPFGSMGIDAADYDGDGRMDLVVTNYEGQPDNLYRAVSAGFYEERARLAGIASRAVLRVAWGIGFADLDHDGHEDLFIANGHLNPRTREMNDATSYEQPNRLFRNLGDGRFEDVTERAVDGSDSSRVSRGAAFGDLDNDGDLDLVIVNATGRSQLLRNDTRHAGNWASLRLVGHGKNRDAIGARVAIEVHGRTLLRERRSSGSYLSANDPRLHFGLGDAAAIERLEVRWPDGHVQIDENLPVNRPLTIRKAAPKDGRINRAPGIPRNTPEKGSRSPPTPPHSNGKSTAPSSSQR